jgi:single-strand binding protein
VWTDVRNSLHPKEKTLDLGTWVGGNNTSTVVMNKVMLIGNVGKDPEVRYYEADTAVAQVSLATTERGYTLQNGTKVPDRTDWHTVVFWKSLAKAVEKYVHKGDKLFVEGKVRYRSYDDKQGKRQYVTEIWADSLELLTPRAQSKTDVAQEPKTQPEHTSEQENNNLPF